MRSLAGLPGRLLSKVSQLEAEVSMIIDQPILNWLTAQAKASPRLRMNLDLRYSPTDHKSSIKDDVVGSGFRGPGIGRAQVKHIIG